MLGLDRVTAARFGFLLGIPALAGAAVLELPDAITAGGVGLLPDPGRHRGELRRRLR